MPVRCTIHSSDVSTFVASSAFETARAGNAAPDPRTQARIVGARPRDASGLGSRARRSTDGGAARLMSGSFRGSGLGGARTRRAGAKTVGLDDHFPNLAKQFLTNHVIG